MDWGRKWLVDEKLSSFWPVKSSGPIDAKMAGSVLEEKSSFKNLRLFFCPKLDLGSFIFFTVKISSEKLEP